MRYCAQPGYSTLVERGRCAKHRPKESDRPNADVRKWYHSRHWAALRARVLREEPICAGRDDGLGCGQPTTDVDHIEPHRGSSSLFWDRRNLQGKCHRCHSAKTGRGE